MNSIFIFIAMTAIVMNAVKCTPTVNSSSVQTASSGENVSLVCPFVPDDTWLRVHWKKAIDNEQTQNVLTFDITDGETHTDDPEKYEGRNQATQLIIKELQPSDAGTYWCKLSTNSKFPNESIVEGDHISLLVDEKEEGTSTTAIFIATIPQQADSNRNLWCLVLILIPIGMIGAIIVYCRRNGFKRKRCGHERVQRSDDLDVSRPNNGSESSEDASAANNPHSDDSDIVYQPNNGSESSEDASAANNSHADDSDIVYQSSNGSEGSEDIRTTNPNDIQRRNLRAHRDRNSISSEVHAIPSSDRLHFAQVHPQTSSQCPPNRRNNGDIVQSSVHHHRAIDARPLDSPPQPISSEVHPQTSSQGPPNRRNNGDIVQSFVHHQSAIDARPFYSSPQPTSSEILLPPVLPVLVYDITADDKTNKQKYIRKLLLRFTEKTEGESETGYSDSLQKFNTRRENPVPKSTLQFVEYVLHALDLLNDDIRDVCEILITSPDYTQLMNESRLESYISRNKENPSAQQDRSLNTSYLDNQPKETSLMTNIINEIENALENSETNRNIEATRTFISGTILKYLLEQSGSPDTTSWDGRFVQEQQASSFLSENERRVQRRLLTIFIYECISRW